MQRPFSIKFPKQVSKSVWGIFYWKGIVTLALILTTMAECKLFRLKVQANTLTR